MTARPHQRRLRNEPGKKPPRTAKQAAAAPSAPTGSRAQTMLETRAALVQAGKALFAEQGLDGPSLDAICERAGFTRGAFYVHFPDREAFLVAVMDHVGALVLDTLLATEGAEGLDAIAARFIGAIASGSYPLGPGGSIRFHQLLDACARVAVVRKRYVGLIDESVRRLDTVLGADVQRGRVRDDVDTRTLASLLMTIVLGAQTMMELGIPFDVAGASMTLLKLIAPATKPTRKQKRSQTR